MYLLKSYKLSELNPNINLSEINLLYIQQGISLVSYFG